MRTERARSWPGQLLAIAVGLQCATVLYPASGQDCWDADIGAPGMEGYQVDALAVGADGVYIGGTFWGVGGVTATNLARWNGQQWFAVGGGVGSGLSHGVGALLCAQGNLYVGGWFDQAGSVGATNVARWDGDRWWSLGLGISGLVRALATSDGCNIYVGGSFTNAGGIAATNVARWDGARWHALGGGITGSAGGGRGAVDAIAIGEDGLYVGGSLTNASGVRVQNVARWDGTMWWSLGEGIPGRVRSLVVQGGKVYAGCVPFIQHGTNAVYLLEWNGRDWLPLGAEQWPAAGGVLALAPSGKDLYVGGWFVRIGGVVASRIARWDGHAWSTLGTGIGGSPIGGDGRGVSELACTGSELFVGGYFQSVGGRPATNIALWHIPHSVTIKPGGNAVHLSWPVTGTNFLLEAREDLQAGNWAEVSQPAVVDGEECVVTNDMSAPSAFYRLRRKAW